MNLNQNLIFENIIKNNFILFILTLPFRNQSEVIGYTNSQNQLYCSTTRKEFLALSFIQKSGEIGLDFLKTVIEIFNYPIKNLK